MAKPIPEGFHTMTPYLTVRGASDAIAFHARAFGAREKERMTGPDGRSVRPLADKFWGDRFGQVEDPFGHRRGLATHKEDVRRAQRFMASGAAGKK